MRVKTLTPPAVCGVSRPTDDVRSPYLQIDRAKIVADQATHANVLTAAADRTWEAGYGSGRTTSAGVIGRLQFKTADGAD